MADLNISGGGSRLVSAVASAPERTVSITDRMVRKAGHCITTRRASIHREDIALHIRDKRSCSKQYHTFDEYKVSTRYIIMIQGLPLMSLDDFEHILLMNENIRSIRLDMATSLYK